METQASDTAHPYEQLSRLLVLTAFVVAFAAAVAAPALALSWSHRPFPGFLLEQTLVVTSTTGSDWTGEQAGIQHPQRVTRIGGRAVATPAEYHAVLSAYQPGQQVAVLTKAPDQSSRLFPFVTLKEFPRKDLISLFWLPYLVGLVYLGIGVWIYLAKGQTRPGRALAFFCINTALVCLLLFDLSTTHALSALWTIAIALTGGALISLAMRFPEEWTVVKRRVWLLALPYGISLALAAWGLVVLNNPAQPWAYITAWSASYRYDAIAVLLFLGVMWHRARAGNATVPRRQARVVLLGSFLAFVPVTLWFIAPVFGVSLPFRGPLFLPGLLIFPVAVAVAILRYRLSEADTLVNRTVVYGILSAILVGVFAAASGLTQRMFVAFTGEESDAAIVITTLVVVAAFTPLRSRVEKFVEARVRHAPDSTRDLKLFGQQVQAFTRMSDAELLTRRLLDEAVVALKAQSGAMSLVVDGHTQAFQASGRWTGEAWLSMPLEYMGMRFGMLFLGPRQNHGQYSREEFETLTQVAQEVARAVRLDMAAHALLGGQSVVTRVPSGPGQDPQSGGESIRLGQPQARAVTTGQLGTCTDPGEQVRDDTRTQAQVHERRLSSHMENQASVLVVARPGRLRDGWRALLLSMPQIETVSTADDTATALRLARTQEPELVLLDVEPFGDDAWTLLEQIKAELPRCLCIVLAGDTQELRVAQSTGASAALVKGFPAARLFETVNQLLPGY